MGRKKHIKQAEVRTLPNVFVPASEEIKTELKKIIDQKNITFLEVGCGKGEYSLHLAKNNPNANCIGIDRAGARIWKAAKDALELKLDNVFFILWNIEILSEIFPENSVDYVVIPFPNPVPYSKNFKKVLYNEKYLSVYLRLLKPGGGVLLKTDDDIFFSYATDLSKKKEKELEIVSEICDLYSANTVDLNPLYFIQTTFEKEHLKNKKKIKVLEIKKK